MQIALTLKALAFCGLLATFAAAAEHAACAEETQQLRSEVCARNTHKQALIS